MAKPKHSGRFQFLNVGFHGDQHLVRLADLLLKDQRYFVETGANVGTTLAHVARSHPEVACLSCEPDDEAHEHADRNTADFPNVSLFHEDCVTFLERLTGRPEVLAGPTLYWLDAHGWGFEWPLREEIEFLTRHAGKASILIDDFRVPGLSCFGYDEYEGQICAYEYIQNSFAPDRGYRLYYPAYTERTSTHHPLRGWCLIQLDAVEDPVLPAELAGKVKFSELHSRVG